MKNASKTEIKKALYKEKPMAKKHNVLEFEHMNGSSFSIHYKTTVLCEEIDFIVPQSDMGDAKFEDLFQETKLRPFVIDNLGDRFIKRRL